ncbi:DUF2760 domain-containing protein [Planctomycetaceae bacterium SH139]
MSLGTAFRAFFAALGNRDTSAAIQAVLDRPTAGELPPPVDKKGGLGGPGKPAAAAVASPRSEAVTLLAMLQRESRLVDLVQEPLEQFSDAQVGAAARPCLQQCQQTLQRVFALTPLVATPEGQVVEIPENPSPLRYQWLGDSGTSGANQAAAGKPSSGAASTGTLVHAGWLAKQCELAQWTGPANDALVVAPAQVQA